MRTELRFLMAIALMIVVLVGTNLLFPPTPPEDLSLPEDGAGQDAALPATATTPGGEPRGTASTPAELTLPSALAVTPEEEEETPDTAVVAATDRLVVVEGPLVRHTFSSRGARMVGATLTEFESFQEPGPVEMVPAGSFALDNRLLVGSDTLDLASAPFEVAPAEGIHMRVGGPPETLSFSYRHPSGSFEYQIDYTFHPDSYLIDVAGTITGIERGVLITHLGTGVRYNEGRPAEEARSMAYVTNHTQDGIRSRAFSKVDEREIVEGPFLWAAFKSKYFIEAVLAGGDNEAGAQLGGLVATPIEGDDRTDAVVTQMLSGGRFAYRLYIGPQDYGTLKALGNDLEDANPYGWKLFQVVTRPFVGVITGILIWMHERIGLQYGWVLILFGVLMRVVLFPLNQKAMRSQIKNMTVQPLLKEIQDKYKNNPEKLQKEMMKLYKEHGFNPLGGCLPMLIPWPVLIALFFVFQYTIQLRGVSFLWLPDLSGPDPLFVLPVFLGVSMFLLQWVSMRSMPQTNPQMKMMMWFMPIFMVVIFLKLASGLNLYYATANLATLPQQYWIAQERKKAQEAQPAKSLATPEATRTD